MQLFFLDAEQPQHSTNLNGQHLVYFLMSCELTTTVFGLGCSQLAGQSQKSSDSHWLQ